MYDTTKPYTNAILDLVRRTWNTSHVSVVNGVITKKFSYPEYHHTDGIGGKGRYHWMKRTFANAVIDSLAMNLNDLAMARARPYALTDHLMLPKDDGDAILAVMRSLTEECQKRDIAITGGETAIHDNIEGLELSIAMLGFIENPRLNRLEVGDSLIGIESNGLHSNGFGKVREVFGEEYDLEFTRPTRIYLDDILALDKKCAIHGMMHVTGGAFSKLRSLIGNDKDILITNNLRLRPQEIFYSLSGRGVSDEEMYKTFNCGIGFIFGVNEEDVQKALSGMSCFSDMIGKVINGSGKIRIKSQFSGKEIVL